MKIITDQEIADLLAEPKVIEDLSRLELRDKSNYSHRAVSADLTGEKGNHFKIKIRQSSSNFLDFSIILTFKEKSTGREIRLVRYNGKHPSPHTNKWEKMNGEKNYRFGPGFHIHKATQRYQESGLKEDGFAQETESFIITNLH